MTKKARLILTLALLVLAQGAGVTQDYRIEWNSVNSGGGRASGGAYTVSSSVGQTAANYSTSAEYLHWIGFWSGGPPALVLVVRASDAKLLPLNTQVNLVGQVATSTETDFSDFIYIQNEDKTSGIRVELPEEVVISGLLREKSIVNVVGVTGKSGDDERLVRASSVIIVSTRTDPVGPVTVSNMSLGGSDLGAPPLGQYGAVDGLGLNNVGLLVRTFGRVTEVGPDYIVISDGSPVLVRVSTAGLSSLPEQGDFVSVTGMSSLYLSGGERLRLVLPRDRSDIWPQ